MARFTYHKHRPNLWEDLDLSDLVNAMSEFLLGSGFGEPADGDNQASQEDLKNAIINALMSSELLPDEDLQKLFSNEETLNEFLEKVIERLMNEGFIQTARNGTGSMEDTEGQGEAGGSGPPVKFELSEKGTDFLGYRALRELMGALGRSSFGSHDTQDLATGVDASGPSKPYEFGDTMNLDVSETLLNTIRRTRDLVTPDGEGLDVGYEDLVVRQTEYRSSCATVVMLDCSHSMILYGEDRFTPAKRVALALAHLIRTQYPGDSLHAVLFHDSAEEIPLKQLGRVRVGPYYTNTREGLRLARRILERQKKDMRQIVMITDGKPSALTRPDGQIYKNAFGLDPFIVSETFAEVNACQKAGIMINTFMLARDHDLVAFVRRVAAICRGKAYFTTPYTLGQYVLMDYMDRKTKTIH